MFAQANRKETTLLDTSLLSSSALPTNADPTPHLPDKKRLSGESPGKLMPSNRTAEDSAAVISAPSFGALPAESHPHLPFPDPLLHDELSGRVQKFRSKRARLRGGLDPTTADFDFDSDEADPSREIADLIGGQIVDFADREPDAQIDPQSQDPSPAELMPQIPTPGGLRVLSGAAVLAGETPLSRHQPSHEPVEIILDSGPSAIQASPLITNASTHPLDLLGRRFTAGLVDAAVLLVGFGLFATIFWVVRPQTAPFSFRPLSMISLGVIAVFFLMIYFGISVAFTSSTPGLAWMGLEIRNLDGEAPSTKESCWRAFGYLVSASALFLGFVWALLDSDGLTWHDLMSGTYITERETL
ncbi:MAG TPA: RDD family protein [Terriglobia bacterium]|nr:RDD family protein [Terriglobia bacterium]